MALRLAPSAKDHRQHERFRIAAPYSEVQVQRAGGRRVNLSGHVYDISVGGMRFELDRPLPAGVQVVVQVNLPGYRESIKASGTVVRFVDPDEPGPARMAMAFDHTVDLNPHRAA